MGLEQFELLIIKKVLVLLRVKLFIVLEWGQQCTAYKSDLDLILARPLSRII